MLKASEGRPAKRRPRGQPDTRAAILRAADELMVRRGFHGFSYHNIAQQLGVRSAAIHYHFPAKDDLGIALVRLHRERFRGWAERTESEPLASERLKAYWNVYLGYLDGEVMRLCPGGVLASEFSTLSARMQTEARALIADIHRWLMGTLSDGRADGSLRFEGDPADKAVEIGAALQGGLQIARLSGCARFRQLLTQLELELTGRVVRAGPLP